MSDFNSGYAGDVNPREAWDGLAGSPDAVLVDVRTSAEWAYVGVPQLTALGKQTLLVEWDEFPSGRLVPDFLGRLKGELDRLGAGPDTPIYFLCRSGNRSKHAALAATAAGYTQAFNVAHGFEGRLGPERHRDSPESWKGAGLPWVQS